MLWKTWNDQLSLILVVAIIGLWLVNALLKLSLDQAIVGATIVLLTNVGQYYYRKWRDETDKAA